MTSSPQSLTDQKATPRDRLQTLFGPALAVALVAILLRIFALGSDPYGYLDWSAGQLTDEGFYIHNARNLALYGQPRTDEFNNMLLSPLLHLSQVIVFKLFGAGAVQARSISVVCGLLTLPVMGWALHRAFGLKVALTGMALLALDHTNVLFNRMALMDTPAALPAALSFAALLAGISSSSDKSRQRWLVACGALLALTITNRTLCIFLLPAPIAALWRQPSRRTDLRSVVLGFTGVTLCYLAFWFIPHRTEITHMSQFYRKAQLQPPNLTAFIDNITHALVGDARGLSPYHMRHVPVQFILVLMTFLAIAASAVRKRRGAAEPPLALPNPVAEAACRYLAVWVLAGWVLLAVVSYGPSRYYVTIYPALNGLAALAVWNLKPLFLQLTSRGTGLRIARAVFGGWLGFHIAETFVHRFGVLSPDDTALTLFMAAVAPALALTAWPGVRANHSDRRPHMLRQYAVAGIALAWCIVNGGWYLHWFSTISYSQRDASEWVARNLPPDSVLVGDPAPGLCLDNEMMNVPVFPGLANYKKPLEKFEGRPRFIAVVTDSPLRRKFWSKKYGDYVAKSRLIKVLPAVRWDIALFAVDPPSDASLDARSPSFVPPSPVIQRASAR